MTKQKVKANKEKSNSFSPTLEGANLIFQYHIYFEIKILTKELFALRNLEEIRRFK